MVSRKIEWNLYAAIKDMLKESYDAKLKTLPKDTIKIGVRHPNIFTTSEELLSEFIELKWKLMKTGRIELEARSKAWEQTNFEESEHYER